ncbi:MAG: hypothetical protein KDE09_13125 [Anaerolineales bacterium]|nr:hypothetical protein [Anaerolineales bacterium]
MKCKSVFWTAVLVVAAALLVTGGLVLWEQYEPVHILGVRVFDGSEPAQSPFGDPGRGASQQSGGLDRDRLNWADDGLAAVTLGGILRTLLVVLLVFSLLALMGQLLCRLWHVEDVSTADDWVDPHVHTS